MTLKHLDLFSGIGGFAIAAQENGFETIGFCEREPYAQQLLKEKFGAVLANAKCVRDARRKRHWSKSNNKAIDVKSCRAPILHPDIFTLSGHEYTGVDLITGGFPCQPFSVAGKQRGAEDDRHLWPEMCRVIEEARPAWVLGENVAGIIAMELDNCISDLEAIGYSVWPIVVPACAVDARHRRDRVWIVAHSTRELRNGRWGAGSGRRAKHSDSGENVADANGERGRLRSTNWKNAGDAWQSPQAWKDEGTWFAKSGMGRVAHGIPARSHRLKGLGNAIVPQVASEIIRAIRLTYDPQ